MTEAFDNDKIGNNSNKVIVNRVMDVLEIVAAYWGELKKKG